MDCRVRYSEASEDATVKLHQLLDYFQDCATVHTEDLGIGFLKGIMKDRAWFLLAYDVTIRRAPALFENIRIKTVPYHMRRYYGYRRFYVMDENDECIVEADSIWILMDLNKLTPVKIPDEISLKYVGQGEEEAITIKRKIPEKHNWKKVDSIPVLKTYIDTNSHVNNTWYAVWAEQLLPEKAKIRKAKIDYRKAAMLGDTVDVYLSVEEDACYVRFSNQEDVLLALLKIETEEKDQ